jgi:hypothetical protein
LSPSIPVRSPAPRSRHKTIDFETNRMCRIRVTIKMWLYTSNPETDRNQRGSSGSSNLNDSLFITGFHVTTWSSRHERIRLKSRPLCIKWRRRHSVLGFSLQSAVHIYGSYLVARAQRGHVIVGMCASQNEPKLSTIRRLVACMLIGEAGGYRKP